MTTTMTATAIDVEQARFNMIQQQIRPWDVLDPGVLNLLASVRREDFVPEAYRALAFSDVEIPLGAPGEAGYEPGQVMLTPKMEARFLQELELKNTDRVLEIGTGSGNMAALLAAKAEFVYSVEIDARLAERARANLARAGVVNVSVDVGDGAQGWGLYAPYDAIVLSGSTPVLPDSLLQQLKLGGRLVAIVGQAPAMQLKVVTRRGESAYTTVSVLETALAPLVHAACEEKFVF